MKHCILVQIHLTDRIHMLGPSNTSQRQKFEQNIKAIHHLHFQKHQYIFCQVVLQINTGITLNHTGACDVHLLYCLWNNSVREVGDTVHTVQRLVLFTSNIVQETQLYKFMDLFWRTAVRIKVNYPLATLKIKRLKETGINSDLND